MAYFRKAKLVENTIPLFSGCIVDGKNLLLHLTVPTSVKFQLLRVSESCREVKKFLWSRFCQILCAGQLDPTQFNLLHSLDALGPVAYPDKSDF